MSERSVSAYTPVVVLVSVLVGVALVPRVVVGEVVCNPAIDNDPKCKIMGCWCIAAGTERDAAGYCRNPKDVREFCEAGIAECDYHIDDPKCRNIDTECTCMEQKLSIGTIGLCRSLSNGLKPCGGL